MKNLKIRFFFISYALYLGYTTFMSKILKTVRNYFCYCGIEKEEYQAVKKSAYVSNFNVWKLLHVLMAGVFTVLFVSSLISELLRQNMFFYLALMIYSIIATVLFFFILKKDSIISQLVIYLSISALFVFSALITQNKPDVPATTFIVFLLITPMFMIDKPYYMAIELGVASLVFLVWMYYVKSYDVYLMDMINVLIFLGVGIFIHIIANSVRIKEFVLTRQINIQKDLDDLTGLQNKGAITRQINEYLNDKSKDKGLMFLLDIDGFKKINDTFGHDVGDVVLNKLGVFLKNKFINGEIVGRFGGDEFIIFIKDVNDKEHAGQIATEVVDGAASFISYPNQVEPISISMGISIYRGSEKNYSEIFKKADIALYQTKANKRIHYSFY